MSCPPAARRCSARQLRPTESPTQAAAARDRRPTTVPVPGTGFGSATRKVTTCCGSKPRSIALSVAKLRIVRPAPISRTSASATSPTTSVERRRAARAGRAARGVLERRQEVDRRSAQRRREAERDAGDHRDRHRERQHAEVDADLIDSRHRDRPRGDEDADAHHASSDPIAPPPSAIRRLSVSICWTIRQRLAPSASRIAISRWRPSARESIMFARFAQPISRTNATAPESASSAGRMLRTTCS